MFIIMSFAEEVFCVRQFIFIRLLSMRKYHFEHNLANKSTLWFKMNKNNNHSMAFYWRFVLWILITADATKMHFLRDTHTHTTISPSNFSQFHNINILLTNGKQYIASNIFVDKICDILYGMFVLNSIRLYRYLFILSVCLSVYCQQKFLNLNPIQCETFKTNTASGNSSNSSSSDRLKIQKMWLNNCQCKLFGQMNWKWALNSHRNASFVWFSLYNRKIFLWIIIGFETQWKKNGSCFFICIMIEIWAINHPLNRK